MIGLRVAPRRIGPRRACRVAALLVLIVSGCQTASYYQQAITGQLQILSQRRPLGSLIADTNTPATLRKKLELVLRLRAFAERELKLPVDGHYERYVDVHRRFVVWDVQAAPEFSLRPKKWWYPIVGRLSYRGYFSEAMAQRYAAKLEKQGLDVYVGGVEAYSTLGWFKDPVLNTFINNDEADLAETLFHELAHQKLFFAGDTEFDEAFATAVAEEGTRRWLANAMNTSALENYEEGRKRHEQFVRLVMEARAQLKKAYGEEDKESRPHSAALPTDSEKRRRKQDVLAKLHRDYEALKTQWAGKSEYDGWFAKPINNARLNTIATYYDLVSGFQRLLESNGGELEKFYREVQALKKIPKETRHELLRALGGKF